LRDAIARAEALTAARGSDDFIAVSAAFKRMKNILRQAEEKGFLIGDAELHKIPTEALELQREAFVLGHQVQELRNKRNYSEALVVIARLRRTVDTFFDKVMVLDVDPKIRRANLEIIESVLANFQGIADFSEIVTG